MVSPPAGRDPLEEMERHNREMRKVRSFIRSRVSKNEFEYLYLEHYDRMYRLAESVVRAAPGIGCDGGFTEEALRKEGWCTETITITMC